MGGEPGDLFQGLPSNSVPRCVTSWENKNPRSPRSSVQTIVRTYKHHGTTQPSSHSGRRHVLSPRDERTLVWKVQINPRTTAKDHVTMLEETGTKLFISTVKRVLYRHNLKGCSTRKKPLLQNRHKNARLWFATAHGDEDRTFGEMSSGLWKQK